jgi:serine/threonine protein kinase
LHDHLIRNGGLEEEAARFFTAELTAALAHLHSLGFAFGDMKPENVVIVPPPMSGAKGIGSHVKLTDFAASRPISELGRRALANRRELLATLPDGDWRTQTSGGGVGGSATAVVEGAEDVTTIDEDSGIDDERFEGTDEYQAPEVAAASGAPSIAGDSWALGLTVFQMLSGGRLPEARQVHRRAGEGVCFESRAHGDWIDFPPGVSVVARDFIRSLLNPDPSQRLGAQGFEHIQTHEWLRSLGDASLLHASAEGPSIAAADASGAPPNARWARRHASTLWSPLPQAQPIKKANFPATPNGGKHEWTLHELARSQHLPVHGDFPRFEPEGS